MERLTFWLEETLGVNQQVQLDLIETLLAILAVWVIHRLGIALLNRSIRNIESRYQWHKGWGYLTTIIGILVVGRIWLQGVGTIVTFLGLLTAGIAIALKDPLMNIAGWVYILARKPFDLRDRIEINGVAGDVIDIRIFQFSLLEIGNWVNADQSTGRVLHIPNGIIFNNILSNYTQGFEYIWNEIEVLVTFESDWSKAKKLLEKIATEFSESAAGKVDLSDEKISKNYLLKIGTTTPIIYTSVRESGVLLTIRYMCKPRERRGSTNTIWEDILNAFASEKDIALAYPTQRFYTQNKERITPRKEGEV